MREYACRCRPWVGDKVIEAKLERLDPTAAEPAAPGGVVLTGKCNQRVHLLANETRLAARRRIPCVEAAGLSGPSPRNTDCLRLAAQPDEPTLPSERLEVAGTLKRVPGQLACEDTVRGRAGAPYAIEVAVCGTNAPDAAIRRLGRFREPLVRPTRHAGAVEEPRKQPGAASLDAAEKPGKPRLDGV